MTFILKPTRREVINFLVDRFVKKLEADADAAQLIAVQQDKRTRNLIEKQKNITLKAGRKALARKIGMIKKAICERFTVHEKIDEIENQRLYTISFYCHLTKTISHSASCRKEIDEIDAEIAQSNKKYQELQNHAASIKRRASRLAYCDEKSRIDLLRLLIEKLPDKAEPLVDSLINMIQKCSETEQASQSGQ
jgi:hypothetical protein